MTVPKSKKKIEQRSLNVKIPTILLSKLNREAFERRLPMKSIVVEMLSTRYK